MRETDPAQSPFRRVTVAGFASLMIGVILVAGFGVFALFTGGVSDSWKSQSGAVLQESETGAHYVYKDGVLHPTRNLASALLFAGGSGRNIVKVSTNSLANVPRGSLVGIADAPDSVPTPDSLVSGAWTVCSFPVVEATQEEAGQRSLLAVGDLLGVAGGGTALTDESGMVVTVPGSSDAWLLWRQRKFLIKNVTGDALQALGFNVDAAKVPGVDRAFLNAFESGEPIQAPAISGMGDSSTVGNYHIGQPLRNRSASGDRFFVVTRDGLEEITQVQAGLLAPRVELPSIAQVPGNPSNRLIPQGNNAPPRVPLRPVDRGESAICATAADEQGFTEVRYAVAVPDISGLTRTAGRSVKGAPLADYVVVQPGRGVLVEGFTYAGTSSGVRSLVTDIGQQFPIGDDQSLAALGFGGITRSRMPVSLVALLPQGPDLSQKSAASTVTLS
jgi:type VII secretion protein EccB